MSKHKINDRVQQAVGTIIVGAFLGLFAAQGFDDPFSRIVRWGFSHSPFSREANSNKALTLIGTWDCKVSYPTENDLSLKLEGTVTFKSDGRSSTDAVFSIDYPQQPDLHLRWRYTDSGTYSRNRFNGTLPETTTKYHLSNISYIVGGTIGANRELRRDLDEAFDFKGHLAVFSDDTSRSKLNFIDSNKFISSDIDDLNIVSTCTRS